VAAFLLLSNRKGSEFVTETSILLGIRIQVEHKLFTSTKLRLLTSQSSMSLGKFFVFTYSIDELNEILGIAKLVIFFLLFIAF